MTFKVNDQTTWVVSEFDCWFKIFISFFKKVYVHGCILSERLIR